VARQRVVIEGDELLRKQLAKMVEGLDDLREVGTGAAALIAERAASQAPVATGTLKDDIRTFATKANAGIRVGRKRLPYVGPAVGGHGSPGATRPQGGYMLPQPFIYDAASQEAAAVIRNYEDFIEDLVAGKRPKAESRYRRHSENPND